MSDEEVELDGLDGKAPVAAPPGRRRHGPAQLARYFWAEPAAALPKRASKRATRPPVSMIFCLPV